VPSAVPAPVLPVSTPAKAATPAPWEDPARLEVRLATAVWGAGIGLWEIDFPTDRTRWFSDWCDRLNLDPCDGCDHVARWDANVHADDLEEASRRFRSHLAGEKDHYDAEYRIRDRAGRWRWLFERGRVVERAPDGTAIRMVGVCMDIDARKEAELKVEKSRKRLEVALQSARGGLWDLDAESGEPCHTEFYYRMLGFDRVGRGLMADVWSDRLHPDDRARVCEALHRTIDGKNDLYEAEYRLRHADGTWRWVLDRGRALDRDAAGHAQRLVGFIIETADPHGFEREIIETTNRERQRIGNDLHDGLGQDLTGIALMLRAIGAQLDKEGSAACPDIEDVIGLVNVAIENTRALARGLSPVSGDRDGLTAALQALAARATERYGIPVSFEAHRGCNLSLDETAATHLYRIAQEALTNAMRHSLATAVVIHLRASAGEVQLEVCDDGCGIPPAALAESDGLGLKIMRYRAQMLGGRLAFAAGPGRGATVRCSCPLVPSGETPVPPS
jgi:signal transduction histidine kinase